MLHFLRRRLEAYIWFFEVRKAIGKTIVYLKDVYGEKQKCQNLYITFIMYKGK